MAANGKSFPSAMRLWFFKNFDRVSVLKGKASLEESKIQYKWSRARYE